ncbi:conserved hypothetical protein [Ixodes scapularis]|uniref:STI1 domain-containing protein n=1 Tax=Ixodes scapularis TaxID=6945 RepID=B7Q0N8_IXOSC|nr:conserved hypothetical protein [Ixodes scapularis]|eukprot:XP_002408078.1 conserved hypothetical protein [Ixodes scapularis]
MSSATRSSVVPPAPWVVCKRETLEDLALGEERRVHVLAGTSSAPAPAGGGGTSGFGFGVRSPLFSSGEGKKEGVQRRAKKLQEHKRKWERKLEERELRERAERIRKAREAHQNAAQQSQDDDDLGGMPGGFPGSFFPGGLGDCFQDPEILAALQDPEVAAAFQDITRNPANISKYQSNPKIKNIMTKMAMKMGASAPPPPM